jgi:hypothetical protein
MRWRAKCFYLCITADTGLSKALPNREEGEPTPHQSRRETSHPTGKLNAIENQPLEISANRKSADRNHLTPPATATGRAKQATSTVSELARFFPEAVPVRIPVYMAHVSDDMHSQPRNSGESTVIEYGTPREILFACTTPLEFADVLRLRNSDGSLDVEASVVAVQYHPGKTLVAARFMGDVPNWIVKS